jgi:hypothetical protein
MLHHTGEIPPQLRGGAAGSIYSGCYAISACEVAAVRIGTGRGARHEIILRSGVRLPVPYAQATHLADKIWDGVWADGTAPRRRSSSNAGSRARPPSSPRGKDAAPANLRRAITHTLPKGKR